MNKIEKITEALATTLHHVAGAAVVCMMVLTCVDVVLRFLRISFPGVFELVKMMGGIAVAFAMAHTTLNKGHVAVSIVIRRFPKRMQGFIDAVTSLLGCGLFSLASWQIILIGRDYQISRQTAMTLEIPMYPIAYAMGVALATVSLSLFVIFLRHSRKAAGSWN